MFIKLSKNGMSLVEVLIGIAITVFVVIGSLEMFGRGHHLLAMANHRVTAINLARARMEELKNISRMDLADGDTVDETPTLIDCKWNNADLQQTTANQTDSPFQAIYQTDGTNLSIDQRQNINSTRLRLIADLRTVLIDPSTTYGKKIIVKIQWQEVANAPLSEETVESIVYDY